MSGGVEETASNSNIFLNQKQPSRKNNITVVEMNKSKIKFLNKYFSKSEMGIYKNAETTNPSNQQQYSLQFRMKERFEELYKRIQKISKNMNAEQIKGKLQKRFLVAPNQEISTKKILPSKTSQVLKHQLLKMNSNRKKMNKVVRVSEQQDDQMLAPLQINTTSQLKQQQYIANFKILGPSRYRHKLVAVSKPVKMSNNIKDYLSVQKIRLKDLEDSMIERQDSMNQKSKANHLRSSLYSDLTTCLSSQINSNLLPAIGSSSPEKGEDTKLNKTTMKCNIGSRLKKFQPPFETYYYRDLIWRVAYSNERMIQFPQQYQLKIRVFVGKGNNSRLVKSIISRRPWYQITDKMQQAHVIWTQIKVSSLFSSQYKFSIKNEHSKIKKLDKNQTYLPQLIWTGLQEKIFRKYFNSYKNTQSKMKQNMRFRNKTMVKIWDGTMGHEKKQRKQNELMRQTRVSFENSSQSMPVIGQAVSLSKNRMQNHLVNSYLIGNKKALFQTMSDYYAKKGDDVFNYLPMTFHICNGLEDQKYLKFLNYYYSLSKKSSNEQEKNFKFNAWIVKPGQNTNRGQGITVCLTLDSIKNILKRKDKHLDGSNKTYIVQKYIEKPMLYRKRKFDLRHYIMINCNNGFIKGYWYKQGYVRTTSSQYTLKQGFGSVHLTNDAVQKNLPDYGKFQKGNKISYAELDQYVNKINVKYSFWEQAYPQMKKIATDVIRASASNLDPQKRNNFQIYGLDFMIDQQMQVWLIEVNTNPCLELSCPLLSKIIPKMIESTIQICIDPVYPPPTTFSPKGQTFKSNCLQENGYQLVYDDRFEEINKSDNRLLNDETLKKQEDDCFEDDGEDWNQD